MAGKAEALGPPWNGSGWVGGGAAACGPGQGPQPYELADKSMHSPTHVANGQTKTTTIRNHRATCEDECMARQKETASERWCVLLRGAIEMKPEVLLPVCD